MKRGKAKSKKVSVVEMIDKEFGRVPEDFNFWLSHVLHWHLLLLTLVVFLSWGYFSGQ
jgi:hypothetical protein